MDNQYTKNDFELEQNKKFEKRAGIMRNIGHFIIGLLMIATITGLFGFSFWTKKTKMLNNGSGVEYECILHAKRETPVVFSVNQFHDSLICIALQISYLDQVSIKTIIPEPVRTETGSDRVFFYFKNHPGGPGVIRFNTYPVKPGSVKLMADINNESVFINQFIYP